MSLEFDDQKFENFIECKVNNQMEKELGVVLIKRDLKNLLNII